MSQIPPEKKKHAQILFVKYISITFFNVDLLNKLNAIHVVSFKLMIITNYALYSSLTRVSKHVLIEIL